MVGFGDSAHHSCLVGLVFARHHFCTSLVGWPLVSCSAGGLVSQNLADLFRYARLRAPASLALHLFFGLVPARRYRPNSTGSFRSPRGYACFCRLVRTTRLKKWIKSSQAYTKYSYSKDTNAPFVSSSTHIPKYATVV